MVAKRIEIVRPDDGTGSSAGSQSLPRARRSWAKGRPVQTGKLERDVDAVLRTKGLELDAPVERVLDEFNRRGSKLKPFRGKRLR